jgi:pSer/pThr/pTyr-binding forkhead associated (FHA) protein
MSGKVILRVKNGIGPNRELVFENRTVCTVGRTEDNYLRFSHPDISRRHCLLDIDPPYIHVRDLGSRNGTFVNGEPIGQRTPSQSPEEAHAFEMPEHALEEGDVVRVGSALISVSIEEPADALEAENELETAGV